MCPRQLRINSAGRFTVTSASVGRACRRTSTTTDRAPRRRSGLRLRDRSSLPLTTTETCSPRTSRRPSATWPSATWLPPSTSPSRRPDASWKETSTPPSGILLPNHSIPALSFLIRLHRLPVTSHVKRKIAAAIYKSLSVAQPTYLYLLSCCWRFGVVATSFFGNVTSAE